MTDFIVLATLTMWFSPHPSAELHQVGKAAFTSAIECVSANEGYASIYTRDKRGSYKGVCADSSGKPFHTIVIRGKDVE